MLFKDAAAIDTMQSGGWEGAGTYRDVMKDEKEAALFEGDVYAAQDLPEVPKTLREATDLFVNSAFAQTTFGEELVAHYGHFFRTEQAAFDNAVTDWERQRYFERI